jgi:L-fuconolactonase
VPDFPIVDAHLHLWDPSHFRMPWLDGNPVLDRTYGLAEYRQHTAGVDIAAMVYLQVEVEPAYGLLEAQWVTDRAREDDRIQAIVAWAPLEYGEQARAYLDALVAISPRVKGVRRLIQSEPDDDFCVQPRFVRGVRLLAEYGLSFDLCIYHRHLPNAIRLVSQCPNVSFILDHIAKPNIKDQVLDPWRGQLRDLAAFPNIICKLSGMVTEADHQKWTPADLAPYAEHVVESFGEDRIAFGGDWPVAFQAATYPRWVATLDGLTAGLSPAAKRKLWSDNARRFYRIPAT